MRPEALTSADLAAMSRSELEALVAVCAQLMDPANHGGRSDTYRAARRVQHAAQQRLLRLQSEHEAEQHGPLGPLPPLARCARGDVVAAFKRAAKVHHPDCGGSADAFAALTRARDKALRRCSG